MCTASFLKSWRFIRIKSKSFFFCVSCFRYSIKPPKTEIIVRLNDNDGVPICNVGMCAGCTADRLEEAAERRRNFSNATLFIRRIETRPLPPLQAAKQNFSSYYNSRDPTLRSHDSIEEQIANDAALAQSLVKQLSSSEDSSLTPVKAASSRKSSSRSLSDRRGKGCKHFKIDCTMSLSDLRLEIMNEFHAMPSDQSLYVNGIELDHDGDTILGVVGITPNATIELYVAPEKTISESGDIEEGFAGTGLLSSAPLQASGTGTAEDPVCFEDDPPNSSPVTVHRESSQNFEQSFIQDSSSPMVLDNESGCDALSLSTAANKHVESSVVIIDDEEDEDDPKRRANLPVKKRKATTRRPSKQSRPRNQSVLWPDMPHNTLPVVGTLTKDEINMELHMMSSPSFTSRKVELDVISVAGEALRDSHQAEERFVGSRCKVGSASAQIMLTDIPAYADGKVVGTACVDKGNERFEIISREAYGPTADENSDFESSSPEY